MEREGEDNSLPHHPFLHQAGWGPRDGAGQGPQGKGQADAPVTRGRPGSPVHGKGQGSGDVGQTRVPSAWERPGLR